MAAFTLVAALAVELVLVKPPIDFERVRELLLADQATGVSAGVVLVVGMLPILCAG